MLFSEYLESNDLFEAIGSVKSFAFISSYSNESLSYAYGERTLSSKIESMEIATVANLIVSRFGDKWDKILNLVSDDFKIGSTENSIIQTEITKQKDTTGASTQINTVSGYNSDSLIDDSGTNSNNTNGETTTGTEKTNNYKTSNKALFDNLNYIDKTNIIAVVQKDIANYLTLNIYE